MKYFENQIYGDCIAGSVVSVSCAGDWRRERRFLVPALSCVCNSDETVYSKPSTVRTGGSGLRSRLTPVAFLCRVSRAQRRGRWSHSSRAPWVPRGDAVPALTGLGGFVGVGAGARDPVTTSSDGARGFPTNRPACSVLGHCKYVCEDYASV